MITRLHEYTKVFACGSVFDLGECSYIPSLKVSQKRSQGLKTKKEPSPFLERVSLHFEHDFHKDSDDSRTDDG